MPRDAWTTLKRWQTERGWFRRLTAAAAVLFLLLLIAVAHTCLFWAWLSQLFHQLAMPCYF